MSLPDRGCLQGWSISELVAFHIRDGEQKLLDALGRHPLPLVCPNPDLRHHVPVLCSDLCSAQGPVSNYFYVPCTYVN